MDKNEEILWDKKLIFSSVFVHENILHAIMDRYLKSITCKQWLLLVVASSFPTPPDLSRLAKVLGCSRQNIKKLSISLEKEGYITLSPSKEDGRSLWVEITEKGNSIILDSKDLEDKVYDSLFREFSTADIKNYLLLSSKLRNGFGYLDECFSSLKAKGEM